MRPFCMLFAFLFASTEGKISRGVLGRTTEKHLDGWWFIDKFGFMVGRSRAEMKFLVQTQKFDKVFDDTETYIGYYVDDKWEKTLAAQTCQERKELTNSLVPVHSMERTPDAKPGWTMLSHETKIFQSIRPHIWYVAVLNCNKNLQEKFGNEILQHTKYELFMVQPNDSHIGAESQGLLQFYSLVLAFFCVGIMAYWRNFQEVKKSLLMGVSESSQKGIPLFLVLLCTTMFCQFVAVILEVIVWIWYSHNGTEINSLEWISDAFDTVGHVIFTSLFLSLSFGWLSVHDLSDPQGTVDKDKTLRTNFLSGALLIVHIPLFLVAKQSESEYYGSNAHHEYGTWIHNLIVALRLVYYAVCVIAYLSKPSITRNASMFSNFDKMFGMMSVWFLCVPVALIFSPLFAAYWRHSFITCFVLTVQSLTLGFIASFSLGLSFTKSKAN